MKRSAIFKLIALILFIAGMAVALILVRQQQNLEQHAGGISCNSGSCNDGYIFKRDCSAPYSTCVERSNQICLKHKGIRLGGYPVDCTKVDQNIVPSNPSRPTPRSFSKPVQPAAPSY